MWKCKFWLRFGFKSLRRAVSLDNNFSSTTSFSFLKWVPAIYFCSQVDFTRVNFQAISDGLTTHPGRADSNTRMCFKRQKPDLACFAGVFWCTFRLCFVMKQEKQLRKQWIEVKREKDGKMGVKEHRRIFVCLLSLALYCIAFSSELLL